MSGHNKWSTIKHRKGAQDAKRSKIFSKYSKLISIAARNNPDPDTNASLKAVIDQARSVNMPKDNIERAIKKAGDKDAAALKEITLQAVGPASVALVIEAVTDNSNRTIGEVKNIIGKHNAKMAEAGSLDWMFEKQGVITIDIPTGDADEAEMMIIEAGAQDITQLDDQWVVTTTPTDLMAVKQALEEGSMNVASAQLMMVPTNIVAVTDESDMGKINKLVEAIETNDDVNDVYTNLG